MQHLSTDKLNVIVHHVPFHKVATGYPFVLINSLTVFDADKVFALCSKFAVEVCRSNFYSVIFFETTRCFFYDSKNFRQYFIKFLSIHLEILLLKLIDFLPKRLTLVIIQSLDFFANIGYLIFVFLCFTSYISLDVGDTLTQLIIADTLNLLCNRIDFFLQTIP